MNESFVTICRTGKKSLEKIINAMTFFILE